MQQAGRTGPAIRGVTSLLLQDAVIQNLQTLTESSQRLSDEVKVTEPQIPWRELSGSRYLTSSKSTFTNPGTWMMSLMPTRAFSDRSGGARSLRSRQV